MLLNTQQTVVVQTNMLEKITIEDHEQFFRSESGEVTAHSRVHTDTSVETPVPACSGRSTCARTHTHPCSQVRFIGLQGDNDEGDEGDEEETKG